MAGVLRDMPERPLLVVSSDMNHFADDAQTRRLDRLALDAIDTLDPARVYETVRRNRISMCGMGPCVIVMEALRRLGCLNRCESVGYATSAEAGGRPPRRRLRGAAVRVAAASLQLGVGKGDRHRGGNVSAYAITLYATEPVPIFRERSAVVLSGLRKPQSAV